MFFLIIHRVIIVVQDLGSHMCICRSALHMQAYTYRFGSHMRICRSALYTCKPTYMINCMWAKIEYSYIEIILKDRSKIRPRSY